jgi:hypothetical protein
MLDHECGADALESRRRFIRNAIGAVSFGVAAAGGGPMPQTHSPRHWPTTSSFR